MHHTPPLCKFASALLIGRGPQPSAQYMKGTCSSLHNAFILHPKYHLPNSAFILQLHPNTLPSYPYSFTPRHHGSLLQAQRRRAPHPRLSCTYGGEATGSNRCGHPAIRSYS